MDEAKVKPLIELLFDGSARLDERDDAGQYLGESDSPAALAASRRKAASAEEDELLVGTAGESLGQILTRNGRPLPSLFDTYTELPTS